MSTPEQHPKFKIASVENGHIEYTQLDSANYDFIGRVLTLHLTIEHHMDVMLEVSSPSILWRDTQLRFEQKYQLLGLSTLSTPQVCVGVLIKNINSLRNKLAHRLDFTANTDTLAPLYDAIAALGIPEPLADKFKSDPVMAIEFIGTLILAGLNGCIHSTSRIAAASVDHARASEEAERVRAEALQSVAPEKRDALDAFFRHTASKIGK